MTPSSEPTSTQKHRLYKIAVNPLIDKKQTINFANQKIYLELEDQKKFKNPMHTDKVYCKIDESDQVQKANNLLQAINQLEICKEYLESHSLES